MTDLEFLNAAEAALRKIETTCDRINDQTDADIDTQRNGGVLTLAFANGSQIVVNLQKPLQEIWLAAKAGGFHYRFNGTHAGGLPRFARFWRVRADQPPGEKTSQIGP